MEKDQKQPAAFSQDGVVQKEKNLDDFFDIRGGVLNFLGIFQTANFIPNVRGVQIRNEGLSSSGGVIQGAIITGGTTSSTLIAGVTGVLYGNGASPITSIPPLAGTKVYWVSDSSGGLINRKLTFQNGVLISET